MNGLLSLDPGLADSWMWCCRWRVRAQNPEFRESQSTLLRFFTSRVQRYLHVVLCMSPVSSNFADRARRFPGVCASRHATIVSPHVVNGDVRSQA